MSRPNLFACWAQKPVVTLPTLPPETEIGEFPIVEVPVKIATLPEVPLPVTVTVCAEALAAHSAMKIADDVNRVFMITFAPCLLCADPLQRDLSYLRRGFPERLYETNRELRARAERRSFPISD
jgi:hypothetical protein